MGGMTEAQLFDRLTQRYPSPAWAVLRHVRNQTGYRKAVVRTADAVALSLYPSNGIALHGFEIKVSASDLKKELLDPSKSAEFSEYCDHWWLVLASEDLMKGVECPKSWGVLVPNGKSLKVLIQAPKLEPKAMDLGLVCGLIRKFTEGTEKLLRGMVPKDDVIKLSQEHLESTVEAVKSPLVRKVKELETTISTFEKETGLRIGDSWYRRDVVAAIKYVREHGSHSVVERVQRQLEESRRFAGVLESFLGSVKEESVVGASDQ